MIELPVLWHSDGTRELESLGIDYDSQDLEQRTVTFYTIDVISPNKWEDGVEYCNIHSSGDKWICPMPYKKVKELIEKNKPIK